MKRSENPTQVERIIWNLNKIWKHRRFQISTKLTTGHQEEASSLLGTKVRKKGSSGYLSFLSLVWRGFFEKRKLNWGLLIHYFGVYHYFSHSQKDLRKLRNREKNYQNNRKGLLAINKTNSWGGEALSYIQFSTKRVWNSLPQKPRRLSHIDFSICI